MLHGFSSDCRRIGPFNKSSTIRKSRRQPSRDRLSLEQLEERTMLSFVTSAVSLLYTAFPGEPNDVTVTPGALTHINDNPNISLLSTCPSAEFLRGLSIGVEVSFIVGGSVSFPTIPF